MYLMMLFHCHFYCVFGCVLCLGILLVQEFCKVCQEEMLYGEIEGQFRQEHKSSLKGSSDMFLIKKSFIVESLEPDLFLFVQHAFQYHMCNDS